MHEEQLHKFTYFYYLLSCFFIRDINTQTTKYRFFQFRRINTKRNTYIY